MTLQATDPTRDELIGTLSKLTTQEAKIVLILLGFTPDTLSAEELATYGKLSAEEVTEAVKSAVNKNLVRECPIYETDSIRHQMRYLNNFYAGGKYND